MAPQALLGHREEVPPADVYMSETDAAMRRAAEEIPMFGDSDGATGADGEA